MNPPDTVRTDSPGGHPFGEPALPRRLHLRDGKELVEIATSEGEVVYERLNPHTVTVFRDQGPMFEEPDSLGRHLPFITPEWPDHTNTQVRAAMAARIEAAQTGGSPDLATFGRIALGLNRSARWSEALSTALLGDWADPLYDGTGLTPAALGRLRWEARTIHRQLAPLWQRRTYGNQRVTLLEKPLHNGATWRDLFADRSLPPDRVLDQMPGDRRLADLMARLGQVERDVVLALGRPGVTTWAEAAALTGSTQPDKDGDKIRRKVRRAIQELHRRDQQRTDGPTGLWTPARNRGVR
ncbi:hypothetical protein [Kitasatospora sp. NPDC101183]|uniref:hypothetical protein n=1 Tax=Kitasatospora sp. NPDC101183 TaxID=3364100 RepID=UPI0038274F46